MSVIVKGMEMPKNCHECSLCFVDSSAIGYCYLLDECSDAESTCLERCVDCPLVEVPTPHGRLVDADALMIEVMDSDLDHLQRDDWKEVIQIVQDAPTIIEAEGATYERTD